jgi:NADPH:quinone reductase-like Zn-dependent oxidoreductase
LQSLTALQTFAADPPARDLGYLIRLVAEGGLDPQIADEMSWDDMPAALERLRARGVPGKLVLSVR